MTIKSALSIGALLLLDEKPVAPEKAQRANPLAHVVAISLTGHVLAVEAAAGGAEELGVLLRAPNAEFTAMTRTQNMSA